MSIYSEKDMINIANKLSDIKAEISSVIIIKPNIDEFNKIIKLLLKFIIINNCIIYGSYALHRLLTEKKEQLYEETDIYDIDVYSYNPVKIGISLCNFVKKNGYNITMINGIHKDTYKIYINSYNYCDISYMPKNIYDTIPIIKHNKLTLIHPLIMIIDKLRMFNNLLNTLWRFDKEYTRINIIMKYYGINNIINANKLNKIDISDISDILIFIRQNLVKLRKSVIIGYYAYMYYYHIYKSGEIAYYVPYYEIISTDIENETKIIVKLLKGQFKNIKVVYRYPFFQFLDKSAHIYHNNKLVMIIYGNYKLCQPYLYLDSKLVNIASYSLLLMYLMINYIKFIIFPDDIEKYNMAFMIKKMIYMKDEYLNKNELSITDESPFKFFIYQCIGNNVMEKKTVKFEYDPNKKSAVPKIKYENTSYDIIKQNM